MENEVGFKAPFLVRAIQDFHSADMNFKKNQIITVLNTNEEEYLYFGNYKDKKSGTLSGWFPCFFVQKIDNTTLSTPEHNTNKRSSMIIKKEKEKEPEVSDDDSKQDDILKRRAQRKQRVAKLQQQSLNSAVVSQKRDKAMGSGTVNSRFRGQKGSIDILGLDSPSSTTATSKLKEKEKEKGKEKILEEYVMKSGMMWRRSEKGVWKQKWIVIRTHHICYFHSAVHKKEIGKIAIKAIKNITIEKDLIEKSDLPNLQFCFAINTHKKNKALILGEKSIDNLLSWIRMLDFAKAGGRPEDANEVLAQDSNNQSDPSPRDNMRRGGLISFSESLLDLAKLTVGLEVKDEYTISPHGFGSNSFLDSETLCALLQPRGNKSSEGGNTESFDLDTSENSQPLSEDTSMKDDDDSSALNTTIDGKLLEDNNDEPFSKPKKFITKQIEVEKTLVKVRALYDYSGSDERQLSFKTGDQWVLIEKREEFGWWYGDFNDRKGLFPSNYVQLFEEKVTEIQEVQEEVEDEEESPEEEKKQEESADKSSPEKRLKKSFSPSTSPSFSRLNSPNSSSLRKNQKQMSLIGNFQLGEPLGKGAFGTVYRGINVETGVMVAIKQCSLRDLNEAETNSIMSELELLKELNHNNIVKYNGFIRTEKSINILLEYIEGGSLASVLSKFGPVHGALATRYIKQILQGLVYLHSKGVIHRDIKCSNILLTKGGEVKLADFGLSSKLTEGAEQDANGSPYWMPPEVIQLKPPSPKSDIWSLGATFIELVTGKPPYFELNKLQAMFSIVEDPVPPFPEDISPEMEDFLSKCLQKDVEARPTAQELLNHPLLKDSNDEIEQNNRNEEKSNDDNNDDDKKKGEEISSNDDDEVNKKDIQIDNVDDNSSKIDSPITDLQSDDVSSSSSSEVICNNNAEEERKDLLIDDASNRDITPAVSDNHDNDVSTPKIVEDNNHHDVEKEDETNINDKINDGDDKSSSNDQNNNDDNNNNKSNDKDNTIINISEPPVEQNEKPAVNATPDPLPVVDNSEQQTLAELHANFKASMDQRNIEKTMSIRKTIREILKELETATKLANCPAFKKDFANKFYDAMIRCEDEMGEHIPVDSDLEVDLDLDISDSELDDEML